MEGHEIYTTNEVCIYCGYTYHCVYCMPWPFEDHICQPELPFTQTIPDNEYHEAF